MDAHSNRWLFSSTVIVVIRFLFWLSVWIWNWFMHAQHYLVPEHSSQPVKRFYDLVALLYSDAAKNRCKTPVHVYNNQPKKLSILQVEMHGVHGAWLFGLVPKPYLHWTWFRIWDWDQPLLHSEHNTGYTNNTCTIYTFLWFQIRYFLQHLVTRVTIVPSKQIPKVFLKLAHTWANKNRQLE